MITQKKTFKIGNSVGVVLPARDTKKIGIEVGSEVCIDVEHGKIVIAPLPPAKIEAMQANPTVKEGIANE